MRLHPAFLACLVIVTALVKPAFAQTEERVGVPSIGSAFPAFTLPDVTGRQVSLSDFQGKAILLSFWSCHTDTCFTSVRVIENLLKEYASLGLVAPTVCSEVPPALEKDGYTGLLKQCGTGQIVLVDKDMGLTKRLGIDEVPTTYLIDRNYAIWQIFTGVRPLLTDEFRVLVKSLVTE